MDKDRAGCAVPRVRLLVKAIILAFCMDIFIFRLFIFRWPFILSLLFFVSVVVVVVAVVRRISAVLFFFFLSNFPTTK